MRLAKGVAADDERNRFFVVHGHAGEGFADVARRARGVGIAVGSLGIHVDETHLDGGKGVSQFTIATVALVAAEPRLFQDPNRCQHRAPRCPHGRRRSRRS